LVVLGMKNAVHVLEVRTLDGALERTVALPDLGAVSTLSGDEDDDDFYFRFASFTAPPRVLRTSVASGAVTTWAATAVPAGLATELAAYRVDQLFFPSEDGTQLSMFVVQRKDRRADAPVPLILYGYGGFNISTTPAWRPEIIPWLEAGGAYAAVNLRGGGESGAPPPHPPI